MDIAISGLSKRFGDHAALRGVDLDVRSGELLALLGPSGSGKTTLLRVLAGLERPDAGLVRFGAADAASMSLRERRVGFVFQHYALFRHMSAFENVAFGLKVRPGGARPPKGEIRDRVERLLDLVQMRGLGGRYPSQLSGGQRQRVALARALAIEPQVLLLDEPFGALDAQVRKDLRRWLRRLHEEIHVTSVFVTHDQEEALELADRVVVMADGRIEQVGTPADVHSRPATAFVYGFIGEAAGLDVRIEKGAAFWNGRRLSVPAHGLADGPARLFLRPHDLAPTSNESALTGTIRHARPRGGGRRIEIILSDGTTALEADAPDEAAFDPGRSVALEPKNWGLFKA